MNLADTALFGSTLSATESCKKKDIGGEKEVQGPNPHICYQETSFTD